jgi:hypothetical protein
VGFFAVAANLSNGQVAADHQNAGRCALPPTGEPVTRFRICCHVRGGALLDGMRRQAGQGKGGQCVCVCKTRKRNAIVEPLAATRLTAEDQHCAPSLRLAPEAARGISVVRDRP